MEHLYEWALVCNIGSAIPVFVLLHAIDLDPGPAIALVAGVVGQFVWADILERISKWRNK